MRTEEEGINNFSIVEAVGEYGVSSTTWSEIKEEIGVGKFYEKVAYRKLNGVRSREFVQIFDQFLEETWEHEYECSIKKLTQGKSFNIDPYCDRKYISKNRTFFCSELIAKAYKVLGVMKTERASASFFPNHFAREAHKNEKYELLPMAPGYSLSPLYNIIIF